MCPKNYDLMMYSSWHMVCNRWMDRQADGQKKWHIELGAFFSKINKNIIRHHHISIAMCMCWLITEKKTDIYIFFFNTSYWSNLHGIYVLKRQSHEKSFTEFFPQQSWKLLCRQFALQSLFSFYHGTILLKLHTGLLTSVESTEHNNITIS